MILTNSWFSIRRARGLAALIGAGCIAAFPNFAAAQTASNIRRDVRPLIEVSGGTNGANPLYEGLYDSGALGFFVPPTTNSVAQIPVAFTGAAANPEQRNYGVIGQATQFNIYGMLGMQIGGPEVPTPGPTPPAGNPAQIYSFDPLALRNQGAPITSQSLSPALNYYNGAFNNVIVGAAFYNGNATRLPTVGFVDPTQAMWAPIPFGTIGPAVPDNQGPTPPLDDWSTSVTVMESGVRVPLPAGGFVDVPNPRVPTMTRNQNPDFLFSIPISPVLDRNDPANPGGFTSFQRTPDANTGAATQGFRPAVQLTPALSAKLGNGQNASPTYAANNGASALADGRFVIADTGSPDTEPGGLPANQTINLLGTDYLNGFGQYWDFSSIAAGNGSPQILMFGPRRADDRALLGPGAIVTVDKSAVGISRTGVDQFKTIGRPPLLSPVGAPGNANGLPDAGGTPNSQSVTFFRTEMTASNAGYVDGSAALNLVPGNDQLDGTSLGADGIQRRSAVFFSVDRQSIGLPVPVGNFGGGVNTQAALNQQAGDIYESYTAMPIPLVGKNGLRYNQDVMGLQANVGPLYSNFAPGGGDLYPVDNLRDFDLDTIKGYYNGNATNIMRNFDPVITKNNDTRNPGANVASGPGPRNDVYGANFRTYFSLQKGSVTLTNSGASGADILYNDPSANVPFLFASFASIGLQFGDDIDAISMSRPAGLVGGLAPPAIPGVNKVVGAGYIPYSPSNEFQGIDRFDPAFAGVMSDLMVFSLDRLSPALQTFDPFLGRTLSAADLFITDFDGSFMLYASAESLALNPSVDNIDGLDTFAVPEPTTLVLVVAAIGILSVGSRRSRSEETGEMTTAF